MEDLPYLIAGGGIAGLATSLALSSRPVMLFEKSPQFEEIGAGLQLGPNAVRALQRLGAWEAVEPFAYQPPEIHIRDGLRGTLLKRVRLKSHFKTMYGAPYRVIHRADLQAALLAVVRSRATIAIKPNTAVTGWHNEPVVVEAQCENGSTIRGRYLLACDGVRSSLRQSAFAGSAPVESGFTLHRALVDLTAHGSIAMDCVNLWLCPGAHVVHYPVGRKLRLNIVATTQHGIAPAQAFSNAASALRSIVAGTIAWLPWPGLHAPTLDTWQKDRLLFLGDAAHGVLPFLAQGAAMALEDAAAISTAVLESPPLLEHAVAARQMRTRRIHAETMRNARIYHATGAQRLVRNAFLAAVTDKAFLARLSWIYTEDALKPWQK